MDGSSAPTRRAAFGHFPGLSLRVASNRRGRRRLRVVRWYATDNYYVTVDNQNRLVIYQGVPAASMGFNPKVVETPT